MINKIYKRIHNKYSTLFKFVFFLRHLLGIFFISVLLFLTIPYLFDFQKQDEVIKNLLLKNYSLKLNNYESIKYNFLPTPNLEILNATASLNSDLINLDIKNMNIYPRLINIYNFKNLKAKKLILNKNNISIDINKLKFLSTYIYKLNNNVTFNDLDLIIYNDEKLLINFKDINFSNYGFNKNIVNGQVFKKNFKLIIDDSFKKINFELLNTGINLSLDLDETKKINNLSGVVKAKVLNTNLKFLFNYDEQKLRIYNSFFRSKNLSFNNKSIITHHPFFGAKSRFNIEEINSKVLKNLNLNRILSSKNLIKKINSENIINYNSKKFNRSFIDNLNLKFNLVNGSLTYFKNISTINSFLSCEGTSNLLDEFPILSFNCSINSKSKKKLLKKFSIKYKNKNKNFNLSTEGNINLLNNKINFINIQMNEDYEASKEDLVYFKKIFETTLLNENFLAIFNLNKIKKFILEIS
jgi:hypothetical protein